MVKRKQKNVRSFPRVQNIGAVPPIEPPDYLPPTAEGLAALYERLERAGASPRCAGLVRNLGSMTPSVRLAVNLKAAIGGLLLTDQPDERLGLTAAETSVLQELSDLLADDEQLRLMGWGLFCLPDRELLVRALKETIHRAACQDRHWRTTEERGKTDG